MTGKRLVLFADYVCPYCFLAETGVARLRERGKITIEGAAFELRPAGTVLPHIGAGWLEEVWTRSVEPLAAAMRVVLERPKLMTRTRKAHEAASYARSEGLYAEMHAALYAAYWQDGRDIGRIDVLTDVARETGVDAAGLRVALDIDQCTARVEQDEAWAAQLGIGGVPAYVLMDEEGGGTGVAADMRIGLLRYEQLERWVMQE